VQGGAAQEDERRVVELFSVLGLTVVLPESMLDAVTAVSGTGPALLALALEGLEDGGVAAGLPRTLAQTFCRRAALGVGRILTGGDGAARDLRDLLLPAGDPLAEGVKVLEERGVREAFERAVEAAYARAAELRGTEGGGRGSR
jgi:pyrroline-5-carboxylate reductase